jgi:CBS domain-containing protein
MTYDFKMYTPPEQPQDRREMDLQIRVNFRDRLRTARYAALADAEGFGEICFVVEALGLYLRGKRRTMGVYQSWIRCEWNALPILDRLALGNPSLFGRFDALYESLMEARNDAMHTGAYARHATSAAIELCIGLEDALMANFSRATVADFMVRSPIVVESWQPVAHARQLMLTHSFSNLPVLLDGRWHLLSEGAMAKFLHRQPNRDDLLGMRLDEAVQLENKLHLIPVALLEPTQPVAALLPDIDVVGAPTLWLIRGEEPGTRLQGVLSPFELM